MGLKMSSINVTILFWSLFVKYVVLPTFIEVIEAIVSNLIKLYKSYIFQYILLNHQLYVAFFIQGDNY